MKHPDRILQWVERRVGAKLTYSQYGEDLIVDRALRNLGITRPTYLDVGAYRARDLSNTALFYRRGLSGVCVEPDPDLFELLQRSRRRDRCLNVGVAGGPRDSADFYVMSVRALNTFSRDVAMRLEASGECVVEKVVQLPLMTLNEIIAAHFERVPHFLSVDVEDLDLEVLTALDLEASRPAVICVETLTYSDQAMDERKVTAIGELMSVSEYFTFADTRVNTIFVDQRAWNRA